MALTDTSSHVPTDYNTDVRPSLGAVFADPTFGENIRRMSASPASVAADDMYSHCLVNKDGTMAIIRTATESSGSIVIKNVADASVVRAGEDDGDERTDVQWAADDRECFIKFSGSSLQYRNVVAGTTSTIKTFGGTLGYLGGSVNICDKTGRYWVLEIGGTLRVWDRTTDSLYTGSITAGNWAGMMPSGNYVVIAGSGGTREVRCYPLDHDTDTIGTSLMVWSAGGTHAIPVSGSDGNDYIVCSSGVNGDPDGLYRISMEQRSGMTPNQQVADATGVTLLLAKIGYTWDVHMAHGPQGSGQDHLFVATEATTSGEGRDLFNDVPNVNNTWSAYKQEILDINYLTGAIRRLCHHRSRSQAVDYYWFCRTTCSWDGSVVMWTSNFNDSSPTSQTDHYLIENALGDEDPDPPASGTLALFLR